MTAIGRLATFHELSVRDPKLPLANAESGLSGIAENDRLTPLLSGVE